MTTIYLGLGANIGNAEETINKAIELLGEHVCNIARAPIYLTRPCGVTDQPNFLNTAIVGGTLLCPKHLREFVKEVEQRLGRSESVPKGPREIDIDILLFGRQVIEERELLVPHPALIDRDFVLEPLLYLCPQLTCPLTGVKLRGVLDAIPLESRYVIKVLTEPYQSIALRKSLPMAAVLSQHDVDCIHDVLSPNLLALCLNEARSLEFEEQAKEYGKRRVRQEVWSAKVDPQGTLAAVATWLQHTLPSLIGLEHFERPLEFTDVNVQKYAHGSLGIEPHRDGSKNRNLVVLLQLSGEAVFSTYNQMSSAPTMCYELSANTLLVMRAPGFAGRTDAPIHGVSQIVGGEDGWRYLLGMRQAIV